MYDRTSANLASEEPYFSLVKKINREIQRLAHADGVEITEDFFDYLYEATRRNVGYFPSTYVDFKQGKQIEKEYIFDNVLKIARDQNIFTPLLLVIERYLSICV